MKSREASDWEYSKAFIPYNTVKDMKIIYINRDEMPENTTEYAVCLGMFDGVHKGHRALIERTLLRAKELEISSAVAAFLSPGSNDRIYLLEQQAEIVASLGIDTMFVILLDENFRKITPFEFIEKYLVSYMKASHIVCGFDYTFGINKSGNSKTLSENSGNFGYSLDVIDEILYKNQKISSTAIRGFLKDGNICDANEMLGEEFSVSGYVKKGYQLGRNIGYPTANIEINRNIVPVKQGVYSSFVIIDGKKYKAVTNIGNAPTPGMEKNKTLESYIIGYSGNLYNKYLKISLTDFLREEKKFASIDELKEAIALNVKMII